MVGGHICLRPFLEPWHDDAGVRPLFPGPELFARKALSDEGDAELVSWRAELRRLIATAAPEVTQASRRFACASEADLSHALPVKRDTIEVAASSRRALAATLAVPGDTARSSRMSDVARYADAAAMSLALQVSSPAQP